MNLVALTLGNDISTDVIYPGRFMATVLPSETPQFAFADEPTFNANLKARRIPLGCVLVAGDNFGLRVVLCPEIEAAEGDELELSSTHILNQTIGKRFPIRPLPASRQIII